LESHDTHSPSISSDSYDQSLYLFRSGIPGATYVRIQCKGGGATEGIRYRYAMLFSQLVASLQLEVPLFAVLSNMPIMLVRAVDDDAGVTFNSRNVLDDDELREAIKKFSNWPTIPQLYVNGEFVGGCDLLWQAHENGEFEKVIKGD
jgi:glutaredoxin-related protein